MRNIALRNVTAKDAGQRMIEAGVKPGERVTVVVKDLDSFFTLIDEASREAEGNGFTEEDMAEIVGMKPSEFENIFGRKPNRPLA